jgi:hypothetical protein
MMAPRTLARSLETSRWHCCARQRGCQLTDGRPRAVGTATVVYQRDGSCGPQHRFPPSHATRRLIQTESSSQPWKSSELHSGLYALPRFGTCRRSLQVTWLCILPLRRVGVILPETYADLQGEQDRHAGCFNMHGKSLAFRASDSKPV